MSAMVTRPGGLLRTAVAVCAIVALVDASHGGLATFTSASGGGSTSSGANVHLGKKMAAAAPYHWTGGQFTCLNELWTRESGWSSTALNASSGATGIPQLLPSVHAVPAGWSDPATQISWGLDYIARTPGYGSPCAAWGHEVADGWY